MPGGIVARSTIACLRFQMLAVLDCDLGEVVLQECEFRLPFMRRGTELLASPPACRALHCFYYNCSGASQASLLRAREKEKISVVNIKTGGSISLLSCTLGTLATLLRDTCDTSWRPRTQLPSDAHAVFFSLLAFPLPSQLEPRTLRGVPVLFLEREGLFRLIPSR